MAKLKVGVILAGCGVYDGAEIHEAVITLLALDRAGVETVCMAPNVPQAHVVNQQFLLRHQPRHVEPQRRDVGREVLGCFLEGHEHAGLAELRRAAHEEFHRHQRLAAAGAAADQCRPSARQPAVGDLVQALDAGGRFGQSGVCF